MMMGNDCIIVWLGNEKDDTFYGRAKKKLRLDWPYSEKDFKMVLMQEYESDFNAFKKV